MRGQNSGCPGVERRAALAQPTDPRSSTATPPATVGAGDAKGGGGNRETRRDFFFFFFIYLSFAHFLSKNITFVVVLKEDAYVYERTWVRVSPGECWAPAWKQPRLLPGDEVMADLSALQ